MESFTLQSDGYSYKCEYRLPKYKEPFTIKGTLLINLSRTPTTKECCVIETDNPKYATYLANYKPD